MPPTLSNGALARVLKDFSRRLFFRISTAYFLVFFLAACAQVIVRTALFLTDDRGSRREGVVVYPASSLSNATSAVYRLLSDGGFESCPDVPSPDCTTEIPSDGSICPMLAAYCAYDHFRGNRLEDVVFIVIHASLIFIAIYALARESIPHVIFIFSASCLSAIWALARFMATFLYEKILVQLVDKGKCGSKDEFFGKSFFAYRHSFEGALLGVSVVSVVMEAYVANKLGHIYCERPWRVVQVSSETRRMYRLLLGFSVVVQITGVILPATLGLWVDRLLNTHFREIVGSHAYIYGSIGCFLAIVLPLWTTLGWFALRREWKRLTSVFLGIGVVILCCVLAALASAMFVWTFTTWQFFAALYVVTVILLIAIIILAALCRNNFDKNLDHYLAVQNRLSGMDFAHDHFEKDCELDKGQTPRLWDPEQDRTEAVIMKVTPTGTSK